MPGDICEMNNLLEQLHEDFCKELNDLWKDAVLGNDGVTFEARRFDKLVSKISEAKRDGYHFRHLYSPQYLLHMEIKNRKLDEDLYNEPKWGEIKIINKMINECKEKDWKSVIPHFEDLRRIKIKTLLVEYAIEYAKEKGPFYSTGKLDTIYVFAKTGSLAHDMTLITLVYGKNNQNDAKSSKSNQ